MTQKYVLPVVGIEQRLTDRTAASLVTILTKLLPPPSFIFVVTKGSNNMFSFVLEGPLSRNNVD